MKKKIAEDALKDLSTEEKIKEAARKLFTQKGYAQVKTRDIAAEAGINLALLNYYFRSKEKLFELIMMENFKKFMDGISVKVVDEKIPIAEKLQRIVEDYIDFLTKHPDLPLFILNELRSNPSIIAARIDTEVRPIRSHLINQLQEAIKAGTIEPIEPFHFMANLVGLTIFPFIGRPILQRVINVNDEKFHQLMQERKKLIPLWINAILHTKKNLN
ncbi:MAG: TetR family transcriptional regulator [Bacteroidetes bacterium]|nr:MAG: TetR family transcriptional regulator [Bacteroidota bacterium]